MSKYYEIQNNEFTFIKCIETKKLEDATYCWMSLTDRPIQWDFDLEHSYSSKFGKKEIREGKAKITSVGGLKAGILPIRNEKNRISSYFVWAVQVSDEWKNIPGNMADSCVKKFPPFNAEDLLVDYNKFLFAQELEKNLDKQPVKTTKMKI